MGRVARTDLRFCTHSISHGTHETDTSFRGLLSIKPPRTSSIMTSSPTIGRRKDGGWSNCTSL
jgi:hypothetical protein